MVLLTAACIRTPNRYVDRSRSARCRSTAAALTAASLTAALSSAAPSPSPSASPSAAAPAATAAAAAAAATAGAPPAASPFFGVSLSVFCRFFRISSGGLRHGSSLRYLPTSNLQTSSISSINPSVLSKKDSILSIKSIGFEYKHFSFLVVQNRTYHPPTVFHQPNARTEFIIINAEFIIFTTEFIISNTEFIIFNTEFIIFTTEFIIGNAEFMIFTTEFIICFT